jgi:hypothetical protein
MKEKRAVKTGIEFVKTLAFDIPMFLTEKAKRMKAPHEAKTESSIIGINILKVNGVLMKLLKSRIRKRGRKRIVPIMF